MIKWACPSIVVALLFTATSIAFCEEDVDSVALQQESEYMDAPSYQDNEYCLKCHASSYFTLSDSVSGLTRRQPMSSNYNIPKHKFYNSVHRSFGCTDCHSAEYKNFPHATALRFETAFACIDCHGGDENFAKYHFEEIDAEYSKSVHAQLENGEFTCWKCHDPHAYVPLARRDSLTTNFVVESNKMCLECHGDWDKFHLLSDRELTGVIKKHDWLPNQSLHFKSVRCIECHSARNDSILISHNILPKDSAVSDCVTCHSSNSLLMGTLYKFRTIESRKSFGFVNSVIIENNSYVIGANHSKLMNLAGILIILLTIVAIGVHTIFRIRKSNKK